MTAERKAGDITAVRMVINWLGLGLFALLGVAAVVPLFLIIGDVYIKGIDAINRLGGLWHFLTELPPTPYDESGGIGPMLVGTLYMTALGALLGIAVGFPLGVYIGEMRREKFANVARAGVNVLVEFPTIVVGLFVYAVMSAPFQLPAGRGGRAGPASPRLPGPGLRPGSRRVGRGRAPRPRPNASI